MSSGLLQVFVELGNLHGTSILIESTGVACSDNKYRNRVQVLRIPVLLLACSDDWTCNLENSDVAPIFFLFKHSGF